MISYMAMIYKKVKWLINTIYFDTDCISAFLWVKQEHLLVQLYPGRIMIPMPVYKELSNPRILHLKERLDAMVVKGEVAIIDLFLGTTACNTYFELTSEPASGMKLIGNGEAASIALAKEDGSILASNNLSDIDDYVLTYQLQHITTSDILIRAYQCQLIDEEEANEIWAAMLNKRRRLGAHSFSEYLRSKEMQIV